MGWWIWTHGEIDTGWFHKLVVIVGSKVCAGNECGLSVVIGGGMNVQTDCHMNVANVGGLNVVNEGVSKWDCLAKWMQCD